MNDSFDKPRDKQAHPATIKAADGETDLHRFRVDAVMYGRDREQIERYLRDDLPMYGVAAAHVTGPDAEGLVPHKQRWTITMKDDSALEIVIPNLYAPEMRLRELINAAGLDAYCTYEDYAPPITTTEDA